MGRVTSSKVICDTWHTALPTAASYTRCMTLSPAQTPAPLLSGFSIEDLQALVDSNPYLRGYIQGYLAEDVLAARLRELDGVEYVSKIPDASDKKGDLLVNYRGEQITIECKSMCTGTLRQDVLNDAWEAYVLCKNTDKRVVNIEGRGDVSSVNLRKGGFDILAMCTYPVTGEWGFLFLENMLLPEPDDKPGFIKSKFVVNPYTTAGLTSDISKVLDDVLLQKQSFPC